VGPEHYTYDRYTARQILALMDKVTVRETPDYTASFPAVQTQRVEVVTEAGAHLVQQVDYPKGHPANPMSDVEVAAKFRRLVAPSLSTRQTEAVINIILTLEDMTDLQQLFQALAV
jgi:2-methylcitrate dehydratase